MLLQAAFQCAPVKGWSFHSHSVQISNQNCTNIVVRNIKASRNIIIPGQICLPFLPKREVNFIQQVMFGSRRTIGDFSHLKEIDVHFIYNKCYKLVARKTGRVK